MTVGGCLAVFALAVAVASVGCGGSSGGGPGGGGGGGGGAGGSACPAVTNVADMVTQVEGTGTPPTPAGGTIADGTYVLIMEQLYPPVSASVPLHKQETLEIAAPSIRLASTSEEAPSGLLLGGTFTTAGTQLSGAWQCGIGAGVTFDLGYTATAAQLIVMQPPGTVSTYSKR